MNARLLPWLRSLALSCAVLFALLNAWNAASGETWSEFRGPTGQGLADAAKLPTVWSDTENVVWKQAVPGQGWSSPVLDESRIYLTSAVPRGDDPAADLTKAGYTLNALCYDAKSGELVWNVPVFEQDPASDARIHGKNSPASPTPIVRDGRLYVHFGHQGTACLDLEGKIVWSNLDFKYQPVHGNGGSPILTDDALIFSCDGADMQVVVALDCKSGKLLWKSERNTDYDKKFSFSTPLLIDAAGRKQVISPGSGAVISYDLVTGEEIWRVRYEGYSVIPRPVYAHGLVFIGTGYDKPTVMAIRPDGTGDVTESHVAWQVEKGAPHTPSLLVAGDELYMVSDAGVATCLNAKTGEVHWQNRVGGNYSASPIFAAGRIYFLSEQGDSVVVKAGQEFEELGKNSLGERTLASYAVVDNALLIRSDKHLYRIESK